jgi:hypothetical protein
MENMWNKFLRGAKANFYVGKRERDGGKREHDGALGGIIKAATLGKLRENPKSNKVIAAIAVAIACTIIGGAPEMARALDASVKLKSQSSQTLMTPDDRAIWTKALNVLAPLDNVDDYLPLNPDDDTTKLTEALKLSGQQAEEPVNDWVAGDSAKPDDDTTKLTEASRLSIEKAEEPVNDWVAGDSAKPDVGNATLTEASRLSIEKAEEPSQKITLAQVLSGNGNALQRSKDIDDALKLLKAASKASLKTEEANIINTGGVPCHYVTPRYVTSSIIASKGIFTYPVVAAMDCREVGPHNADVRESLKNPIAIGDEVKKIRLLAALGITYDPNEDPEALRSIDVIPLDLAEATQDIGVRFLRLKLDAADAQAEESGFRR